MTKTVGPCLRFVLLGWIFIFSSSAPAAEISWNGFGSTYVGQATSKELLPPGFDDTHANFTEFSLMGLNLSASIEDNLDFAAQLVALGSPVGTSDSFALIAQWMSINYKPSEGISLRLGRQLYPPLMASEYVRVGYLLPFRQIPNIVYNLLPFTRFDGASAYQTVDLGATGKLTYGIFGGTPILDANSFSLALAGLAFGFADLYGAQVTLDGDGWRVRAQVSRFFSRLATSAPLPVSNKEGVEQSYSVGFRYDKNGIVSWGEYIAVRTPDGTVSPTGRYAEKGDASYLLVGYRIGKFMPRYTYANASQFYDVSPNGSVTSHTLGLNYQAGSQTVVKIQYEQDIVPKPQGGGYFVSQPATSTATSGGAFYAGADFIF